MARINVLLPMVQIKRDERKALVEVVLSQRKMPKKKKQLSTPQ